jgi:CBS domain-containing protein
MRQGAAASTEAVRSAGYRAGDAVRKEAETLAESQSGLMEESAAQFEMVGRQIAESAEQTAETLRGFLRLPAITGRGFPNVQENVSGLVEGVVQTNLRILREMMRFTNPAQLFEAQRQFMHEYTSALLQGTGSIMRIAHRATEQALRPIEEQIEMRQGVGQRGRGNQGVVADVMSTGVRIASPEDSVQQASRIMREEDSGVLPVGEGDRLVGMVTDRDITLRLVAEGKDAARTKVREVMTPETKYVFEDEDLSHVADNMAEQQVRRLPVLNRDKRIVGIISLGDIARSGRPAELSGRALGGISRGTSQQAAE